jgi:hypothetical protein
VRTILSLIAWLMIPGMLFGAPIAVIVMGVEQQAGVANIGRLSGDDLKNAASLLTRYDPTQMAMGEITTIVAREDELNTALMAGLADHPPFRGRVAVGTSHVRIDATLELAEFPDVIGRYVNIAAFIAPSRQGLDVTGFRIGKIELPKPLASPAMQIMLETLMGPGKGAHIVENIQSIDISGKTLAIGYRPAGRGAELARANGQRAMNATKVEFQTTSDAPRLGYNQTEPGREGIQN